MSKFIKVLISLMVISLMVAACAPGGDATPTEPMEEPTEAMEEEPTEVMEEEPTEAMEEEPTEAPTEAMEEEPTEEPTEAMEEPTAMIDCMGVESGTEITMIYQWTGTEEESINSILDPFVQECGVTITAEATRDAAVLDTRAKSTPPDVLFWPSTSPANLYGDQMVDLNEVGAMVENYESYWINLGTFNDMLLALPVKADVKTMIWYSPVQFDLYGYQVPTTFDELNTLVEQMVADGNIPWSMGFESGDATGWTGSDFIQDLLLTFEGPEYVLSIIDGDTPYDDQGVVDAYDQYVMWASDETYTVGGATGTVSTGFLDAIYQVFSDPPEAMMVKQSGFAGGEVVAQFPDLEYGTDFDFFQFPGAQGMQGGADYMMVFNNTTAVQALIHYLTSEAGAQRWAEVGFDISPNITATEYPTEQLQKKADMLAQTTGFTPDLGDALGSPFSNAEWTAIIDTVQGAEIAPTLEEVASAQMEAIER